MLKNSEKTPKGLGDSTNSSGISKPRISNRHFNSRNYKVLSTFLRYVCGYVGVKSHPGLGCYIMTSLMKQMAEHADILLYALTIPYYF